MPGGDAVERPAVRGVDDLSRQEVEEIREWIDDYLEDRLELTVETQAKLDQSRREIAAGKYTTRQAK